MARGTGNTLTSAAQTEKATLLFATFGVCRFYCEWFPCAKPEKAEKYLDAVTGFLSGEYRILEHYRGKTCYKAKLQKSEGNRWQTIATWATIWIPLSFKKTVKELRNL